MGTHCQIITGDLVHDPGVELDMGSLDLDREGDPAGPVETGDVDAAINPSEPHGVLQHHAREGPTRPDKGLDHMLPDPFLRLQCHPFPAHGTAQLPAARLPTHLSATRRKRQFRPRQTRVHMCLVRSHPAKVQRPSPTLGHLERRICHGQAHTLI